MQGFRNLFKRSGSPVTTPLTTKMDQQDDDSDEQRDAFDASPVPVPTSPTAGSPKTSSVQEVLQDATTTNKVKSVLVSKQAKANFMVALLMQFARLRDLKDLDHNINDRDLQLGKRLGGGNFGTVFKAKLRGMDVAVKQLNGVKTNEAVISLKIEVEILARLRHPYILLYIGMSQSPTFSAMITEWCELGSLEDILHNFDRYSMDFNRLLHFALQVAEGMWYMHSMDNLFILHRDIKAANILITGNFQCKIADFGLAVMIQRDREAANLRENGEHVDSFGYCGTPQYMAPEVLQRNQEYGQKCDVYSYGVMLTELATRKMPYLDRYKHLDFIPSVLELQERPTVPKYMLEGEYARARQFGDLILQCLAQEPSDRPPFSEIISQLEVFQELVQDDDLYMFTHFEIPRYLDSLQSTSCVDELRLVARELSEVLDTELKRIKTDPTQAEKIQVLQIVSEQFMLLLLERIESGKSRRVIDRGTVEETGGEYESVQFDLDTLENLICSIRMLSECVNYALPPQITFDQLESIISLFFVLEDNDGRGIKACSALLHQLCHLSTDFQQRFEQYVGNDVQKLARCRKHRIFVLPESRAELELSLLQREVEQMEQELFAKKKRLMELRFNSKLVALRRHQSSQEIFAADLQGLAEIAKQTMQANE